MDSVSVNEAIKKGRWQLFWMPLAIFFGSMGLMAFVTLYINPGDIIWVNAVCVIGTLFFPVVPTFCYYFLMLPRWRIWAFTNVRNVHELKQLARLRKIYPEDKSFQWRLEIKNDEQKRQIEELQRKFDQPDIFEDDYALPFETAYSYSKLENLGYVLFTLGTAAAGIAFLFQKNILPGIMAFIGSIMFGSMAYKRIKANGNGPVLIISNDGITTEDNGFHPWQEIQNEQIFYVSAGKASYYGLSYDANGHTIKMSLKELTGLSSYKIDHVLRTYRGRYEAAHKTNGAKVSQLASIGSNW